MPYGSFIKRGRSKLENVGQPSPIIIRVNDHNVFTPVSGTKGECPLMQTDVRRSGELRGLCGEKKF